MQESTSVWRALSNESASALEKVAPAVVAIHGRRRIPSSGVHWRPGIIVTADHTIKRDEEITITQGGGITASARLAGRDPSTDIAVLKIDANTANTPAGLPLADTGEAGTRTRAGKLPLPEFADLAALRPGDWVLLAARTSEGNPRASIAMMGVVGPAWRSWLGGVLDLTLRLDRDLHPNFSGGPVVTSDGRVIGIATSGLSRYGAVVIPAITVHRVAAELEQRGHIGRGYLGVGMAPVRIPRRLRESLKLNQDAGLLVMAAEPGSPAENAGIALGDLLVALDGSPVRDTGDVQGLLSGDRIGKPLKASVIRAGALAEVVVTVGERAARE